MLPAAIGHLNTSISEMATATFTPHHLNTGTRLAAAALRPHISFHERHARIELATPPWQGGVLPLAPVTHSDHDRIRTGIPHLDKVVL